MKLSLLKKSPEERAYLFANQMPSGTNIQEIHPMFTEKCNSMLGAELLLYTPTSIVLERSTSESFWRQSVWSVKSRPRNVWSSQQAIFSDDRIVSDLSAEA